MALTATRYGFTRHWVTEIDLNIVVAEQESLLHDVFFGERSVDEAGADYRRRHIEIKRRLTVLGSPCYCPWETLHAWLGWVDKRCDGDVDLALSRLRLEIAGHIGPKPEPLTWTLIPHSEWPQFLKSLDAREVAILDTMLNKELAVYGMGLLNRGKLEKCDCSTGGHVFEYKIQIENRREAYKIRVWVETRPGRVFVLLHGLNKMAQDNKRNQQAEKEVACDRRG